jgi:hypothetical protein
VNICNASQGAQKDVTDWIRSGQTIADLQGQEKEIPLVAKIWGEWDNNHQLKLERPKITKLCRKKGYRKLYLGDDPSIIKDEYGTLRHSNKNRLKDTIRNMIEDLPPTIIDEKDPKAFKEKLLEKFLRNGDAIANQVKTGLHELDVDYLTDKEDCVRLFFENGFVEITAQNASLKPYSQLDGAIWEEQKIDHKITIDPSQASKSEFAQFVTHVSDGNKERHEALTTSLGYLTSTHKDKANAKAIILMDQEITDSDQAEGGTGKSLFAEALRHIRNFKYIPGKGHNPNHRFAWQTVELGDQVIFIDDVRSGYKFQNLFNIISNDMRIEKKGKDPVTIPFDLSPKIVIATNGSVGGTGNSFRRRQNIIEFSSHYNGQHTPVDDFGHRLFDDWGRKEWNRYYNFVIWCVQQFLHRGLKDFTKNYKTKKLINETSCEIVNFYNYHVQYDYEYDKKDLYRLYRNEQTNGKMGISQSAFTSQIKKCGDYDDKVLEVRARKSHIEFVTEEGLFS